MAEHDYHLLVVDDEDNNRDLLSRRLAKLGYTVSSAESGARALEIVRSEQVDLVLLDVMMPGIDGLQVLSTLRESHSLVDLPVIMVTARDQGGDIVAALQLGANDYVTKPVNFAVIQARIQTHLNIKVAQSKQVKQPERVLAGAGSQLPEAGGSIDLSATNFDFPTIRERMVIGDYEIVQELGRGGMGVVYKARHVRMDRYVALKLIDRQHLANPEAVHRFYLEVQAAAKLTHPNVVIAFDAGQVGKVHYFAMEYVDGMDLGRLVLENGPLPVAQACDFVRQAALGLQHAHERGMVHRDIKPTNLLVTWVPRICEQVYPGPNRLESPAGKEAVVKVLDLGLALLHQPSAPGSPSDELTREGRVIGSVDYMAPEQWLNAGKVDIRADLYSLGCTFYFLLTGSVPFPGDEAMEKMLKHHLDSPQPIHELRAGVPAKVATVVTRLMAKRPEDRYQTPGALAELLKWICQTKFE